MMGKRAGWRVLALVLVLAAEGLGLGSFPPQPPKPDVDRVLRELQSMERSDLRFYVGKYFLDPEDIYPDMLYMEDILNGLIYLIIQQMGLEDSVTVDPETGWVTLDVLRTLAGHADAVGRLVFSPDGKLLASVSWDGTAKLWDMGTGKELLSLAGRRCCLSSEGISSVAFSPDGKLLAAGCYDGVIKLWDVVTAREVRTLTCAGTVYGLAFSVDGKLLAVGGWRDIELLDVASGKRSKILPGHKGAVESLVFSSDGKTLVSVDDSDTVRVWEVVTGSLLWTFTLHTEEVTSVAFAPGGKVIASGSRDGTIRLWDPLTGAEVRVLGGDAEDVAAVKSIAFSPDGKTLAAAGGASIWLWDVASGRRVRRLAGHQGTVFVLAFSPSGTVLASGSRDKTVRLFDLTRGEGDFRWALQEILGIDPVSDLGVLVEHVELRRLLIGKSDYYTLTINAREIELELEDGFIGFEWGVRGLLLRQYFYERRMPDGTPYVEEKELFIHQVESKLRPGTYISGAKFTRRLYRPNGVLVEVEQWDFIEGNPNSVRYGREVKGN